MLDVIEAAKAATVELGLPAAAVRTIDDAEVVFDLLAEVEGAEGGTDDPAFWRDIFRSRVRPRLRKLVDAEGRPAWV
jgi:hypothetical protein